MSRPLVSSCVGLVVKRSQNKKKKKMMLHAKGIDDRMHLANTNRFYVTQSNDNGVYTRWRVFHHKRMSKDVSN